MEGTKGVNFKKEYLRGYVEGFREALEIVGEDLREEPIEGYELADYAKDYLSHAKHIETHNCVNCREPMKEECYNLGSFYCPLAGDVLERLGLV